MQCGNRHLLGALMIINVSLLSQVSLAQDCRNCQAGTAGGEGIVTDSFEGDPTTAWIGDGDPAGACSGCHGACSGGCAPGIHGGFDPHCLPCNGKACFGYRPFTEASQPDLFYNVYVPNNRGAAAAAYPAPFPTPRLVGHTYYTYQPLMPHEFLYTHHRTYHQFYDGGKGLNRTKVRWYRTPVKTALKDIGGSVGWFLGNVSR